MCKRYFVVWSFVILLLVSVLGSLGLAAETPLKLTTANSWATRPGFKECIAAYEKATKNKVNVEIFPDDQYLNVNKVKISSGETYDIMTVQTPQCYLPFDMTLPLSGSWINKLTPALKSIVTQNGKVYRAPYGAINIFGVLYNKAIFEKVGITPPLKTYKSLLDAL